MFSLRTRFWLMVTITLIMAFFTYNSFAHGSYLWGILMLIFTLFNYESTHQLYKSVGGFQGATRMGGTHRAFHDVTKFEDLE